MLLPFISSALIYIIIIISTREPVSFLLGSDLEDRRPVIHLGQVVKCFAFLELLSLLPVPLVNLVPIESQLFGDFLGRLLVPLGLLFEVLLENIDLLFCHQVIRV